MSKWQKTFALLSTGVTTCILMLYLASWQVKRAQEKDKLILSLQQEKPISLEKFNKKPNLTSTQKVNFNIKLNTKKFFLVDLQIKNHKVGYELLATHYNQAQQNWLIVSLGWIKNPEQAHTIITNANKENIQGILTTPKGFLLRKHPKNENIWPIHLGYIDLQTIEKSLNAPVYKRALLSSKSSLYEALNDPMQIQKAVLKHYNYSLQFCIFGFLALGYCIYLSFQEHHNAKKKK